MVDTELDLKARHPGSGPEIGTKDTSPVFIQKYF